MEVNVVPYAMITRLLLPSLRERKPRSGIIFLNSFLGADVLAPISSVYGATKAFGDAHSQSLSLDNEDKIDILSAKSGPV